MAVMVAYQFEQWKVVEHKLVDNDIVDEENEL